MPRAYYEDALIFSACFWVGAEAAHKRVFGSQSFLKTPRQQLSLCCHLTCQALSQHHSSTPPPPCHPSRLPLPPPARSDLLFPGWAEPVGPVQPCPVPASSLVDSFLFPYSHLGGSPPLHCLCHPEQPPYAWNFSCEGSWKTSKLSGM